MAQSPTWIAILPLVLLLGVGFALALVGSLVLVSRKRQAAIPNAELAALGTAVDEANELAAGGRVGDGLSCLVAGQRRARQCQEHREPWSAELAQRWEQVVDKYATEHHIGPSADLVPAGAPAGRGDEPAPIFPPSQA